MVVNHVKDHSQPQRCARSTNLPHVVRRAVNVIRGEQVNSVVSPAELARELGDRHDLDRCHPQLDQPGQVLGRGVPGSLRGERSDVQFVINLALKLQPFQS